MAAIASGESEQIITELNIHLSLDRVPISTTFEGHLSSPKADIGQRATGMFSLE